MRDLSGRFAIAVLARPRAMLAAWAAVAAFALAGVPRLAIDNSPAAFFLEGTSERHRFERFAGLFGPPSALRIVLDGERLFTAEGLDFVAALERLAAGVDGVAAVSGPLSRRERTLSPGVARDPAALRALLGESPLDAALGFVARRGADALSLLVTLDGRGTANAAARRRVLAELSALAAASPPGVRAEPVGLPTLDGALDEAARRVLLRLSPLLVAASFLLLLATFREASAIGVPLLFVLAVGAVVLGAMGWCGTTFDLVVAVLPPVLFSIALAVAVHLLIRCRNLEAEGLEPRAAAIATLVDKGPALLWTTLSTVAGFGSLAATPVGPIRTLGLWGGFAMLVIGAAAFTLYPCLLAVATERRGALPERRLELALERLGRRFAEQAAERRGAVLALYAVVAIAAGFGLSRLEVESNALAYFPASHPVRAAFARAEGLGMGLATVELVGEVRAGRRLDDARALGEIARLAERLRALPAAISVVALPDLLDEVGGASPLARAFPSDELRARVLPLVAADREGGRAVARFLSADRKTTRITIFVETAGYERIDPLVTAALEAAAALAPSARFEATGQLPLLLATQHRLLGTLAVSIAWALPLLLLVFLLMLRDLKRALYALVPNVWPVAVILGAMGWFGVPVDMATVMVASIVLGLVVDDTIHTLAPFRELAAEIGPRAAVTERLEKTAPAFFLTSVLLAAGFAVCTLSEFLPVQRFGALSVVAIAIALASDLLLVPALFGRRD